MSSAITDTLPVIMVCNKLKSEYFVNNGIYFVDSNERKEISMIQGNHFPCYMYTMSKEYADNC
jgi:hypothetical protein